MTFEPGQKLDRYTIEALLGEGGMGRVYRAFDERLHRRVALKVLRFPPGYEPADAVAGALREARAAAAIAHPNATHVFDAGEVDGTAFLAMELVPGTSLRHLIQGPPLPVLLRLRWLVSVAGALGAAHQVGVVHRDVKPENVLVREDGLVKVLDFGIARRTRIEGSGDTFASAEMVTTGNALMGTPAYMSPEQMRGEPVDGRADQFGWGVLAYEVLTGKLPWKRARDFVGYLGAVLTEVADPPSSLAPEISPAVDAVVLRALSKIAADRFVTMGELAATLAAAMVTEPGPIASGPPSTPTPSSPALSSPSAPVSSRSTPPPSGPVSPRRSSPRAPSPLPPRSPVPSSQVAPPSPRASSVGRDEPIPRSRFREPRIDAPIDLDAHLRAVRPGSTAKGLLFQELFRLGAASSIDAAEICRAADLPVRRYVAFHEYPLADYLRLLPAAARLLHPRATTGEGLHRLGHGVLPMLLDTHVGRALFAVLGQDFEALLLRWPKAGKLMLSAGELTAEKVDWQTYTLRVKALPLFLETHFVGTLEGVLTHCQTRGRVRIQIAEPSSAVFEIRLD